MTVRIYNLTGLARLLGVGTSTCHEWKTAGRLDEPAYDTQGGGQFWTAAQVAAMQDRLERGEL